MRAALIVGLVFALGVAGYRVIGGARYGWVDAVYMTVITLTTVGYGEVIDLTHSPGGRIFTTLLLLVGVGAWLSFFSTATAFFVDGNAAQLLWRRRMRKQVEHLEGHTVVCGGGHTGQHIVRELIDTGRPFVLIESNAERVDHLVNTFDVEFPVVAGDATDDPVLRAAGVDRASGVVACLSNDKDNLIVTVSARLMNPDLRIVCRCIDEEVADKIHHAGADAVVSPNRIGGLRMISEMVRPTAVSYLDLMLRDRERNLRVEAVPIREGAALAGATLADLRGRNIEGLLVLALAKGPDDWHLAPTDKTPLPAGAELVFTGGPAVREELERLCAPA